MVRAGAGDAPAPALLCPPENPGPGPDGKAPRKPAWLKVTLPGGEQARRVAGVLRGQRLHTVCHGARCPNRGECFAAGHLTFMLLGENCTRGCAFCGVSRGAPLPVDADEPRRLAAAVAALALRGVVLTSVTRDDLPDGGAAHWSAAIAAVRAAAPGVPVEALIPDFAGRAGALAEIIAARPEVAAHNLEMVPRLYPALRPRSDYPRSLAVLRALAGAGLAVKTGLMLGLGERADEVRALLGDARAAGATRVTIGQYLQPRRECVPVTRYVHPDEFARWQEEAGGLGFTHAEAGPLVRSSYHAFRR